MAPGTAASVSAAYGTMVYLVSVAGGWLADRIYEDRLHAEEGEALPDLQAG
ncbi:hypothetical protein [Streptomyces sp. NRRL F-2580]|uniref:hypothetical protein n=1 Tax=Streptomyces sp. NRRL F-2580 TaxID=1463841 RepID=UPI00131DBA3C|nr:hypothetical protein [Streptomyces sp. NRRL F-2580]